MKKKLVIALDILVVAIVAIVMLAGKSVENIITGMFNTPAMAANEELSFNLKASPEKSRVKAGATVVVTLSVKDIKVGEEGLNNVVGKLGYDEALFKSVEIYAGGPDDLAKGEGTTKWELEINRIKNHSMYGQFCIFTMQEGVKEDQEVATLIFKLKDDLKPQTTKVTFTRLASSDGEVSIPEEDREVEITIYEDPVVPDEPEPEEPTIPDEPKTPDEPVQPVVPVQTADSQTLWIIITLISTIIINILVFAKTKKNKILGSILVVLVGFLSMQYAAYAAEANQQELLAQMAYKETWLNSENYLVTEENISRIAPNTDIEALFGKFNKAVEVKNGDEKVTAGKISTGMTINVENPGKQDAEGDFKYIVSVFGDINGDSKADHVDLTDTIRTTVNKDKWNLDGVKEISADIKLDNKIDREDVLASVKHIVYGELEIPTFEQVKAPEIKITQATKDNERNCYTGEVKVAITQKQEDAIKTQYKISKDGEETVAYTEINGEITLSGEGVYKVSAYTTGKLGNRSEIPYILVNIDKEKAQYTVEYYYDGEKDDNQTETGYAIVGTEITEVEDKSVVNSVEYGLDLSKGNGTGIENLPLIVGENVANNIIKVYYNSKYGKLTIHHYNYKSKGEEEKVKVAEDEIFTIEYDKEYTATNLMTNTNKITIDGIESTIARNYLEQAQYTYKEVEYDTENATATTEGVVTGTAVKGMKDVSYYYEVKEFTITGETDENATIKDIDSTGLIEKVEYNKDSNKVYINAKPGYKISKIYKYTGDRINGDYTADDGEELTLQTDRSGARTRGTASYRNYVGPFISVKENIHLVVKTEVSYSVVKIIGVPIGLEEEVSMIDGELVLGHEYESLEDAIYDAEELNKKRTEENAGQPVTIQILSTGTDEQRVINENNIIKDGSDVVIDLNGQKIESSSETTSTLEVWENCSLTIIDDSNSTKGAVENTSGIAIKANAKSTFTLGANDPIPNIDCPTIEGALYGVYKDPEADFNFYDGKIIGHNLVAVGGNANITDTPDLFEAVTKKDENDSNTQIEYLSVPSGVVAMIQEVNQTYTTLESAFKDAERLSENGKQVEIDLLANVALVNENNEANETCIIEIPEGKNILLDLNGHYVTATKQNDLFINKGTFEIKDTTSEYADYYDDEYYTIHNNGEYYFEFNEFGELQSNNNGKFDKQAASYIEIDLTDKDESEEFEIKVEAYMYGGSPRAGYMFITESSEIPEDLSGGTSIVSSPSGKFGIGGATKVINGGKKYYMHLIYRSVVNGMSNDYEDEEHIYNITINGKPMFKEFYKGSGVLKSTKKGITNETSTAKLIFNNVNCDDLAMITNNGELESNNSTLYALTNNGDATINEGSITKVVNNEDASLKLNEVYSIKFEGIKNQSGNVEINDSTITGNVVNGQYPVTGKVIINNSTIKNGGTKAVYENDITITNSAIEGDIQGKNSMTIKDSQVDYGRIVVNEGCSSNIENITGDSSEISNSSSNCIVKNAKLTNSNISNGSVVNQEKEIKLILENCELTKCNIVNNYCDLQIIGGTLEMKADKDINNQGTLTIGEQGSPVSSTSPKIIGTIRNEEDAITNFYDGSITAPENSIFKNTKELNIEENYSICITREEVDDKVYETATLGQTTPVAKILKSSITNTTGIKNVEPNSNDNDSNYYYFATIENAIDACPDNSANKIEIQVIDKIYLFKQLVVDADKNIEIKLNGNQLYSVINTDDILINKGKLSITDDQIGQGIVNQIYNSNAKTYYNNLKNENTGTLELNCIVCANSIVNEGTTIINGQIIDNAEKVGYYTLFKNSGNLIFNGGFTERNIENISNGTVTINGGNIATNVGRSGPGGTIYVKDNSKLIINDGKVGANIIITEHENPTEPALEINGGFIGATNYYVEIGNPITNTTPAEIIIKSADLDNKINITTSINTTGKITIEDVVKHANGIRLETSDIAIIKNSSIGGAKISAVEEKTSIIDNCDFGGNLEATGEANINMTNTTIKPSYGLYAQLVNSGNGDIVVTNSGEIENYPIDSATNSGAGSITFNNVVVGSITNSGSGSINIPYSNKNVVNGRIDNTGNGNVIIGTEDSTVDTEYPKITGNDWGIRNSGTGHIYVYDGSITGKTNQAKSGNIDCLAGYELLEKETGDTNRQTLILGREFCSRIEKANVQNTDKCELSDDGLYYQFYTIQDAIDATKDNTDTIVELTRSLTGSSAITVESSKNIVLDINGYGLNISTDNLVTNNGKLTIKNSKDTGDITVTSKNLFTNNSNMTLQDIVIKVNKSGTEDDRLNVINNSENATFNMINTQIIINGSKINAVENNGTFNMSKLSKITRTTNLSAIDEYMLQNYGKATITNSNIEFGNVYNYDNAELYVVKDMTDLPDDQKNNNYGIVSGAVINDGTNRTEGSSRPKVVFDGGYVRPAYNVVYYNVTSFAFENNDGEMTFKNGAIVDATYFYGERVASELANKNGIINIEDADISIATISNDETSQIKIDGGILKLSSGITSGITNDGTININGGEICGIDNGQTSINNKNTLTIGNKQNSIDTESSILDGKVVNSEDATFNFYDGTLFSTECPIDGKVNDIPTNATIRFENANKTIGEKAKDGIAYYPSTDPVAKIESTEYTTLKDAFDACTDSTAKTIVLQANIAQFEKISIGSNKNIKLDLNGKTIEYLNDGYLFTNAGEFEFTDSSINGEGGIASYIGSILDNTNKLTISGGNYSFAKDDLALQSIVNNSGNGTVTMTGGTINVKCSNYGPQCMYGIKSEDAQDINISGGTITSVGTAVGIYVKSNDEDNKTNVTLSGTCKFVGKYVTGYLTGFGPLVVENCDVNILGGTIDNITTVDSDITIPADSTTQITELVCTGDFDSSIAGGTIDSARFEASLHTPSTVDVHDSNIRVLAIAGDAIPGNDITATISNIELKKLSVETDAIVTFGENVKLINDDNTLEAALHVIKANVTIPENIIIKSEVGPAIGYSGYCTITIGSDDRIVNNNAPYIEGKTYGIGYVYHKLYTNCNITLQFYDGTVHGDTRWGDYTTLITPEHYEIAYSDINAVTSEAKTATIRFKAEFSKAAKVGDTNYTLPEAIEAINSTSNHTGTIEMLDNILLTEPISIYSGMNVTIDLKGKSIYGNLTDAIINVEEGATLTIINTNADDLKGSIDNSLGLAIDNKGTLNIGDNVEPIETDMIDIIGDQYAIDNSGTLNFYDGKIKAIDEDVISGTGTINNAANSTITSTTETINSVEYNVKYLED